MKLIFFMVIIFFSESALYAEVYTDRELTIRKNIFFHQFLIDEKLILPNKDVNVLWYSEKNRLSQVNKKLEILSEIGIDSNNLNWDHSIANFLLKTPASGITKNLHLDARWLEVNPKYNPILRKDDRVVFHDLNKNNNLYFFKGNELCKVSINNKLNIFDYLKICELKVVSFLWIIDSKGNYRKFGISDWNNNENIPISAGSLVITDLFEFKNKLLFEKIIKWISHNFDFLNINYSIINKLMISKKDSTREHLIKSNNNVSPSSWGITGLLDSPSARFRAEGSLLLQINETHPIRKYNVIFSPYDWFEGGFRYISIQNRYYSNDPEFSGTQSYKDKNFELKVRLLKETNYLPQLALGLRDFAGTGLFSSEYLTSSKRFGNLDFTLGVGFGSLSSVDENIDNPFSFLKSEYEERPGVNTTLGGDFNYKTWFRGEGSFFGGANYSFNDNLSLKLDYSTNQYNDQYFDKQSIFNYGIVYASNDWIYLHLGSGSSNDINFGVSIKSDLTKQVYEEKRIQEATYYDESSGWINNVVSKVKNTINWEISSIIDKDNTLIFVINNNIKKNSFETKLALTSEIINLEIPKKYSSFEINFLNLEIENKVFVIDRNNFALKRYLYVKDQVDRNNFYKEKKSEDFTGNEIYKNKDVFSIKLNPSYKQTLGGPDGFVLYSLGAKLKAEAKLSQDSKIIVEARKGIIDNYNKYKQIGKSNVPQVRTHLRQYNTQTGITLPSLQLLTLKKYNSLKYMFYVGAPEEMFAGYGGELFYPLIQDLYVSYDYNKVKKREFRQLFSLRDYSIETSHINLYYLTPISSLVLNYAYGKYLAGDKGYTINLFRKFNNGSKMGAFFTRTNLSFEDFGEGSFDKGIYFEIPFDNILPIYSNNFARIQWKPLSRDGGAMLKKRKIFNEMF